MRMELKQGLHVESISVLKEMCFPVLLDEFLMDLSGPNGLQLPHQLIVRKLKPLNVLQGSVFDSKRSPRQSKTKIIKAKGIILNELTCESILIPRSEGIPLDFPYPR